MLAIRKGRRFKPAFFAFELHVKEPISDALKNYILNSINSAFTFP